MSDTTVHLGQRIVINGVEFAGPTAARIAELGVPVFTKMAHLVELADAAWRSNSSLADATVAAHARLKESKQRLNQAEEYLLDKGSYGPRQQVEIEAEHGSAVMQHALAQADVDRLLTKSNRADRGSSVLRDRCLAALAAELGGLAPAIFDALNWR